MRDLKTFFTTKRGVVKAVNGVSYCVEAGKTLGVVGESGSGKSVSAMSMLKLLDGNGYIAGGSIVFDGKELTKLSIAEMQKIRGNDISVIFQEPMTSLNPVFTVERQVAEPFIIHQGLSKEEARRKAEELERKKKEIEEARRRAEEERRRKAEEEARKGMRHANLDELVFLLNTLGTCFLCGPAGSGKTTLAINACRICCV